MIIRIGDTIKMSTDTKLHAELVSAVKSDIKKRSINKNKKSDKSD